MYDIKSLDLSDVDVVEVSISSTGNTLWINTAEGCVLRISKIKQIVVEDARTKEPSSNKGIICSLPIHFDF